ncbi:hypothetical protein JNB11_04305 [Kocuria palustris]|nr:hypothetical protein [Kocuria palustris]
MGSGGTVKVDIDRLDTNGTFTNHDIVRGVVTLAVTDLISLALIDVKLEGITRSELKIPEIKRRKSDKERMRTIIDVHKVLYDSVVVFPPPNVRNVQLGREFTLTPGNYTYPFEFTIPLELNCVKVSGITNKVLFNKKNMNVVLNNGNFNQKFFVNKAKLYLNQQLDPGMPPQRSSVQQYHISAQLPPLLLGMDDFALVKYFVKVTCKRLLIFKQNLRSYEPFVFLPLDLDIPQQNSTRLAEEEYREVFVRKQVVFSNRIPDIIGVPASPPRTTPPPPMMPDPITVPSPQQKRGFFKKIFDPSTMPTDRLYGGQINAGQPINISKQRNRKEYEIQAKDVPFGFEIRFRHPAFLIPDKPPSFRLFLVSNHRPLRYELQYGRPGELSGLGVVYLQKLSISLTIFTSVLVLEDNGNERDIHNGTNERVIPICNNVYENLKFDLVNAKPVRLAGMQSHVGGGEIYEIEIPKQYFSNCVLPEHLSPTFRTCNISRKYLLTVLAGFSLEKVHNFKDSNEINRKVKNVELVCPNVRILSGLQLTLLLHSNALKSSVNFGESTGSIPTYPKTPPYPATESGLSEKQQAAEQNTLPTYTDVMREASYQDDQEHQRARRRYKQHEMYYHNLDG